MLHTELYGAGPAKEPTPEYPDQDQLRAYGDFTFLYMRAEKYQGYSLGGLRLIMQPPIDLRLFRVLRIDGVPRAGITWAFLSDDAEARLCAGKPLSPSDWLSGPHLWIMELIAPYPGNLGGRLTRRFLDGLTPETTRVRFPRFHRGGGGLKHVTEWHREQGGKWRSRRLTPDQLETLNQYVKG